MENLIKDEKTELKNLKNLSKYTNIRTVNDKKHTIYFSSGNIISHKNQKYYTTKTLSNAIIYGIRKSSSYPMLIKPTIDINSRSCNKHRKSMIINDMDSKIYEDTKQTLKSRGYKVIQCNNQNNISKDNINQWFYNEKHPCVLFVPNISNTISKIAIYIIKNRLRYKTYLPFHLQFILNYTSPSHNHRINHITLLTSLNTDTNFCFLFQFDSIEQIRKYYGKTNTTILIANCPVQYYVLSNSKFTRDVFGKSAGHYNLFKSLGEVKKIIKRHQRILSDEKLKNLDYGFTVVFYKGNLFFNKDEHALPLK